MEVVSSWPCPCWLLVFPEDPPSLSLPCRAYLVRKAQTGAPSKSTQLVSPELDCPPPTPGTLGLFCCDMYGSTQTSELLSTLSGCPCAGSVSLKSPRGGGEAHHPSDSTGGQNWDGDAAGLGAQTGPPDRQAQVSTSSRAVSTISREQL